MPAREEREASLMVSMHQLFFGLSSLLVGIIFFKSGKIKKKHMRIWAAEIFTEICIG